MLAPPAPPAQTMCEVDVTAPMSIAGRPRIPMPTCCTEALAVEESGLTAVETLAHSVPALIRPLMVTTQGGALLLAPVVATGPACGVGEMPTRPEDFRP